MVARLNKAVGRCGIKGIAPIAAAGLITALGLSSPAFAQTGASSDRDEIRQMSTRYADCAVARRPDVAADIVEHELTSERPNNRRYALVSGSQCMVPLVQNSVDISGLRWPAFMFRYMLAEGLVRRYYRASGPTDLSSVPPLNWLPVAPLDEAALARRSSSRQATERAAYNTAVAVRAMAGFSECVVRGSPEPVRQLALTEPASDQESTQFDALRPQLNACLTGTSNLRMSRSVLRGALMVSYFRLANAVQPPAELAAPATP